MPNALAMERCLSTGSASLSAAMQSKLLRLVEERRFHRVGGEKALELSARVVCAALANLEVRVAAGTFRDDLFYRINIVTITRPPLRERPDDVPLHLGASLSGYFRDRAQRHGRDGRGRSTVIGLAWQRPRIAKPRRAEDDSLGKDAPARPVTPHPPVSFGFSNSVPLDVRFSEHHRSHHARARTSAGCRRAGTPMQRSTRHSGAGRKAWRAAIDAIDSWTWVDGSF